MEEYRHNFKDIAQGRGPSPLNPMECDNFFLPHTSLRVPLPELDAIPETGSIKRWQPRTQAMAIGLMDRVWSLRDVLMYRVPPWQQPHVRYGLGDVEGRDSRPESCACKAS